MTASNTLTEAFATPAAAVSASRPHAAVAAIVVHYRGLDDTLACVASLREHAPAATVFVIDNASPDGSGRELARRVGGDPGVEVLAMAQNLGFGGGCNRGIDAALARVPGLAHVLLLNPDARLHAGTLAGLLATASRHPDAGIVGCRIVDERGCLWFGHGRFPRWTLSRFHCKPPAGTEHATGFVSGALMLLDAGLLRAGLRFDERFFLYGEDADLCRRVQQQGRSLWVTQAVTATHRGGGSQRGERVLGELTAAQLYWMTRSKVLLAARHLRPQERIVFAFVAAVLKPLAGLLRFRRAGFLRPYFAGLWAGWRELR